MRNSALCAAWPSRSRSRRAVLPFQLIHVGEESNKLEEVEAGLEHDLESIWTVYEDSERDLWTTQMLPILKQIPLADLESATGLSERALRAIRNEYARSRKTAREALARLAQNSTRLANSTQVRR
jgi:hypothetical protein